MSQRPENDPNLALFAQTATTNDAALLAIEDAFTALADLIAPDPTDLHAQRARASVLAISRTIRAAIVSERTLTEARIITAIQSVAGLRADIQRLILATAEHKDTISGRIHSLANHLMGMENRLDEMTELITTSFSSDYSGDFGQSFDAVDDSERRADI